MADEGQPESAEEASPADVTAAVQGEEINAVPVPIPEETESAAALPEAEAEPSAETVSEGGEEAYSEEPAEKNEEEPVTDGAAIEIGTEAPDASHAEENAAAESTGETASAENKAAGIPEATGPVNTESPSGRSEEKTASSEEAHSPADAGKGSSSDTFSDETEKGAREVSDEGAATDAEELKADVPAADASADISERTLPAEDISGEINRCIISDTEIADDASHSLKTIRREIKQKKASVSDRINSIMRAYADDDKLQEDLITQRNGRYCVPVKAENKSKVPGMIHDRSQSGSTFFIEPIEIVNLNNEITELEIREKEEIERILMMLSASLVPRDPSIKSFCISTTTNSSFFISFSF